MEPTKTTRSFRINDDIWELLKNEAKRRDTTASALVKQAIIEHISGVLKTDGDLDVTDLISLIGGLQEQTSKLVTQLDDAKKSITKKGQG